MKKTIAILGAGGWGGNWTARALRDPDVEAVAFADANPAVLDGLAERGVPRDRLFSNAEEALDSAPSDAVTVSIPNPHRVPFLMRALSEGRHILVDKPLVHTAEALDNLLAAAKGRETVLMVAQNYRLFEGARRVRQMLASGELGKTAAMHAHFLRDGGAWRGRPVGRLGGILSLGMEMCIHHVDMMRYFLGEEAEEVTAQGWSAPWSGVEGLTGLDFHFVFPGGCHAAYDAGNVAAHSRTDWCGHWEIVTEGGAISYGDARRSLRAWDADGREIVNTAGPDEDADTGQSMDQVWTEFKDAMERVAGGGSPLETFCSLEDNAHSVRMVLAADCSLRERRPVPVSDGGR